MHFLALALLICRTYPSCYPFSIVFADMHNCIVSKRLLFTIRWIIEFTVIGVKPIYRQMMCNLPKCKNAKHMCQESLIKALVNRIDFCIDPSGHVEGFSYRK